MNFSVVEDLFTISADSIVTLAIASVVLLCGMAIKNKVKFLQKYCIPSPVVGGFLLMLIIFAGHMTNVFTVEFDTTFQTVFMVAFFTTVGLSADFRLLKKGGKLLLIYWLCAALLSAFQSPIAMGLGNLLGMENAYSITAGAVSMSGGHGAATAYGSTLIARGYPTAQDCGLAAATFGLIFSVIIGGPISRRLIKKYNLKPNASDLAEKDIMNEEVEEKMSAADILKNFVVIVVCMALGMQLAKFASMGLGAALGGVVTLPDYLGAMAVSVIVRNLNEKFHFFNYNAKFCDGIGNVTLDVFLSIAMMSIKLWELLGLVGPLVLIVSVQVILVGVYGYFVVFRATGKTYDSAVMVAGMCGHCLGATPTAMANMEAVCSEHGFSKNAFVIVPIVGAFLVDCIYQPVQIFLINAFVPIV